MAISNPPIRFHYEDYKTLPESMSARYELLDGALLMVPAPTISHQRVSRNLEFMLIRCNRLAPYYVYLTLEGLPAGGGLVILSYP